MDEIYTILAAGICAMMILMIYIIMARFIGWENNDV